MQKSDRLCGEDVRDSQRFRQLFDSIKRGKKKKPKRQFVKALVEEGKTEEFALVTVILFGFGSDLTFGMLVMI